MTESEDVTPTDEVEQPFEDHEYSDEVPKRRVRGRGRRIPSRERRGRGRGGIRRRGRGRGRKKRKEAAPSRSSFSPVEVPVEDDRERDDGDDGDETMEENELPSYGEEEDEEDDHRPSNIPEEEEEDEHYEMDDGSVGVSRPRHGLTWTRLNDEDIIRQDQIDIEEHEVDQPDQYVGANRRNGVYVEGGKNFKFRANLEDFLVKQNYKGMKDQGLAEEEGDGEVEDQTEIRIRQYEKFKKRLTIIVLGLFGFMKGVLAGMCFLFLLMVFIPFTDFSKEEFLDDYKPLSSTLSKIFILMTTICFVCSVFVINVKCWSPETSKFHKLNMGSEGIAYFVILCCSFFCLTAEDYFTSHDVSTASNTLDFYFYLWQVMNWIRSVLAILTYLVGTLCSL